MIHIIKICFVYLLLMTIIGCERENPKTDDGFQPGIVVEGHIEQGDYPLVYLTRNIPYYAKIDSADIVYLVIRQAKVEVSDGIQSEILTLMHDQQHFPPFYYRGTELTGKTGSTYTLTITYGSDTLTATTTIPLPVKPDSVWFHPEDGEPGRGKIFLRINDDPAVKNYYRMFTCVPSKQSDFYPTLNSTYNDKNFNGTQFTFQLNQGPESYINLNQKDYLFDLKDTILMKICTLDEIHYNFWVSYNSEILNAGNPFATSFHGIASNIHGKGYGIWGGYGVTVVPVIYK